MLVKILPFYFAIWSAYFKYYLFFNFRIIINNHKTSEVEENTTPICTLDNMIDLNIVVKLVTFSFPYVIMDGSDFCIYNVETKSILTDSSNGFKKIACFGQ